MASGGQNQKEKKNKVVSEARFQFFLSFYKKRECAKREEKEDEEEKWEEGNGEA